MLITTTENPRQWQYTANDKTYTINIDEDLEYLLLQQNFQPDKNSDKRITKLKGIEIEKIFKYMIENNYHFEIARFHLAIQQIKKNESAK